MSTKDDSQIEERLAEERSALVGKIAAGLAHDLNGPIGIVLGFNDLSREIIAAGGGDGGLSTGQVSKISEYLDLVDGAAKRARTLTQEIWEFAKSQPGSTIEFAVEDQLSLAARLAAPALRSFGIETPEQPPEQSEDGVDGESAPAASAAGALITADPSLCAQAFVALFLESPVALPAGGQLSWRVSGAGGPDGIDRLKIEFQARTWENEPGGLWPVPPQAETAMRLQGGRLETPGSGGQVTVVLPSQDASMSPST